ncbi:PmoA family protein [uncultured Arcticibacterium sp.]|uniref:DUF6807 domain-containing protein n=1 Tax=uncultured Arcticibacterium sp. TaxID=2173042 RepID=UPI0030F5B459
MKKNILLLAISLFAFQAKSQKIASFKVSPKAASASSLSYHAQVSLDKVTFLGQEQLSLIEVSENVRREVPFQIENGKSRILHWKINQESTVGALSYDLIKRKPTATASNLKLKRENGLLTVNNGSSTLLGYKYEFMPSPEGIDPVFGRSGFIHPLNTPKGDLLTRIQPDDHYHHYGVWNPWTHVLFEGDTLDFWNLKKKQGTVRFAQFLKQEDGPVFAEYSALHEHVVLKDGSEKVALNEVQNVRVYQPEKDLYVLDFSIDLSPAGDSPFHILEYRYGGFSWRATEVWTDKNSVVITSEGKSRKESDGSTARWCIVKGELGENYGGAVLMSHPTNYNHPEPLRIWPEGSNGDGDMFVNFAPTKNMDWVLEPNNTYNLKYRLLIFNGKMTAEKAEAAWQEYVNPIKIETEKTRLK